jgi:hypothetical protein
MLDDFQAKHERNWWEHSMEIWNDVKGCCMLRSSMKIGIFI